MDKGVVIVFGLFWTRGACGVWVLSRVADEAEARALAAKDPAVGLNRVEIYAMSRAIVRK